MIVIIVDIPMERVSVQIMGKHATDVVGKTTLRRNADKSPTDPVGDPRKIMVQEGQIGPKEINVHTDVVCMKYMRIVIVMMTMLWRT